jgi:hypothetical protein
VSSIPHGYTSRLPKLVIIPGGCMIHSLVMYKPHGKFSTSKILGTPRGSSTTFLLSNLTSQLLPSQQSCTQTKARPPRLNFPPSSHFHNHSSRIHHISLKTILHVQTPQSNRHHVHRIVPLVFSIARPDANMPPFMVPSLFPSITCQYAKSDTSSSTATPPAPSPET